MLYFQIKVIANVFINTFWHRSNLRPNSSDFLTPPPRTGPFLVVNITWLMLSVAHKCSGFIFIKTAKTSLFIFPPNKRMRPQSSCVLGFISCWNHASSSHRLSCVFPFSNSLLYSSSADSYLLSVHYEVKRKAVYGEHILSTVCCPVLGTKRFVIFYWNSVRVFYKYFLSKPEFRENQSSDSHTFR